MLRALIVDDHALVREGMALLLQRMAAEVEVVHAASLKDALAELARAPMGLVILDYFLPDAVGDEPISRVLAAAGGAPIIVLSGEDDGTRARRLLKAGARGYLPKHCSGEVMRKAIELVLQGGSYLPESLLGDPPDPAASLGLTPRQHEVIRLVVEGKSNKEIASSLGTSESTVRAHLGSIFRALGVSNRTQVAQIAMTHGLV